MKRSDYDKENRLWMFMDAEEEKEYVEECYERVIDNPRFYLDNLERLDMFRTRYKRYKPYKDYKSETFKYFH
jgi:hypothetical protein